MQFKYGQGEKYSLGLMGISVGFYWSSNVVEWMTQKDLQARKRRLIINDGKVKKKCLVLSMSSDSYMPNHRKTINISLFKLVTKATEDKNLTLFKLVFSNYQKNLTCK